jgi:hypothetical protein
MPHFKKPDLLPPSTPIERKNKDKVKLGYDSWMQLQRVISASRTKIAQPNFDFLFFFPEAFSAEHARLKVQKSNR